MSSPEVETLPPLQRGDRVRVPKGTIITGTFRGGIKEARRSYVVTVFDRDDGWPADRFGNPGMEPRVCWVGTGGYWHYAREEDVEREVTPS